MKKTYCVLIETNGAGFEVTVEADSPSEAICVALLQREYDENKEALITKTVVRLFTKEVKREQLFRLHRFAENSRVIIAHETDEEERRAAQKKILQKLECEYEEVRQIPTQPGGDDKGFYKLRCEQLRLSYRRIAEELGVSPYTAFSWEAGKSVPCRKHIKGLAPLLLASEKEVLILFGRY